MNKLIIKPCSKCGCTGIHACMGGKVQPWTTDAHRKFESAIQRVKELRS